MLNLESLTIKISKKGKLKTLIDEVSMEVPADSIVGLIGESGSGKSLTAMAMAGFFYKNLLYDCIISLDGESFLFSHNMPDDQHETALASLHKSVAVIPQETYDAIDPLFTIGYQYTRAFKALSGVSRKRDRDLKGYAIQMLEYVSLNESYYDKYPGRLSGGERQRAVIGFSLISRPKILIMDEPTAGLDWDIKKDMISFLRSLQKELKFSILMVSHDLGQICEMAERLYVMYAGTIVEESDCVRIKRNLFSHPYTIGLFESIITVRTRTLKTIPGEPPDIFDLNGGCSFYERCNIGYKHVKNNISKCKDKVPVKRMLDNSNWVRCWHFRE